MHGQAGPHPAVRGVEVTSTIRVRWWSVRVMELGWSRAESTALPHSKVPTSGSRGTRRSPCQTPRYFQTTPRLVDNRPSRPLALVRDVVPNFTWFILLKALRTPAWSYLPLH
jgi:hypothetical protein